MCTCMRHMSPSYGLHPSDHPSGLSIKVQYHCSVYLAMVVSAARMALMKIAAGDANRAKGALAQANKVPVPSASEEDLMRVDALVHVQRSQNIHPFLAPEYPLPSSSQQPEKLHTVPAV